MYYYRSVIRRTNPGNSGNSLTLPVIVYPQTFNSLERRRRRVGAADVKEEGVETEDGAGNPAGNTPTPHNTGVGVSTRRTTYVMVSERTKPK